MATGRLVKVSLGEALRVHVGVIVGHAGIAVAQPHQFVVADGLDRALQLFGPYGGKVVSNFWPVHHLVQDVALFPAGGAHQERSVPFGDVPGDGWSPF